MASADAHIMMQVLDAMTPEEKQSLKDSVASLDDADKKQIYKRVIDARAKKMGLLTDAQRKIVDNTQNDIAKQRDFEAQYIEKKPITQDANGNFVMGGQLFKTREDAVAGQMRGASAAMRSEERKANTPAISKIGTLFKRNPQGGNKQVGTVNGKPAYMNSKGQTYIFSANGNAALVDKGQIVVGETVDNRITNDLVDKKKLPESYRENIPQSPITGNVAGIKDGQMMSVAPANATAAGTAARADTYQSVPSPLPELTTASGTTAFGASGFPIFKDIFKNITQKSSVVSQRTTVVPTAQDKYKKDISKFQWGDIIRPGQESNITQDAYNKNQKNIEKEKARIAKMESVNKSGAGNKGEILAAQMVLNDKIRKQEAEQTRLMNEYVKQRANEATKAVAGNRWQRNVSYRGGDK